MEKEYLDKIETDINKEVPYITLPFTTNINEIETFLSDQYIKLQYGIKNKTLATLSELFEGEFNNEILLISSILIYLYRINEGSLFKVTLSNLFINYPIFLSLFINFKPNYTFYDVAKKIANYIQTGKSRECFFDKKQDVLIVYNKNVNDYKPTNTQFSLIIVLNVTSDQFCIFYNPLVFYKKYAQTAINNLFANILTLLNGVVEDLDCFITNIPIINKNERMVIVDKLNATCLPSIEDKSIHQLFEVQAKKNPDKQAIGCQNKICTYTELNCKANQLARYLLKVALKRTNKKIVGICVERSIDLVVGLLAILKSGCAYVPLDPDYPEDRLHYIFEDSGSSILLTQLKFKNKFNNKVNNVFYLDEISDFVTNEHSGDLNVQPHSSNLAYIIYTSGSTGKPKGVMVNHASVVNFLISMGKQPGISSDDKLLAITTIAFDIAGLEIWLPLVNGAQVVIANESVNMNSALLAKLIEDASITMLQATPATWQMLIMSGWQFGRKLKLLSGGDKLTISLASKLLANGHEVWNLYGPTETTIWSTIKKILPDEDISIGKPIENTKLYILDSNLQLVPIGIPGELYIGGAGLAEGYVNQHELTASKFILIPFSDNTKDKFYKTGDIARYLPDGNIELLGRIDDQVKIRGYRIELGEIENLLRSDIQVKDSIVITKDTKDNEKQLVAYIIAENNIKEFYSNLEFDNNRVLHWKEIYSEIYLRGNLANELEFNIAGWNSSYTNQSFHETEMREWVNQTVDRIIALNPTSVLEIGCGYGLLLTRLAPLCQRYTATDVSLFALQYIEKIKQLRSDLSEVKLLQRAANDINDMEDEQYDVVIINSVIQYFPSVDYLIQVIKQVSNLVKPEGAIFIGDVRNLNLLKAYHASVKLHQAAEQLDSRTLKQQIDYAINAEEELVLAPEFFVALQSDIPSIKNVQIYLKRGRYNNELNCFRYDVILYLYKVKEALLYKEIVWLDKKNNEKICECISGYLEKKKSPVFGVRNISNKRLEVVNQFLSWLESSNDNQIIKDFKNKTEIQYSLSADPIEILQIAEQASYFVELCWRTTYPDGSFDAIFSKKNIFENAPIILFETKLECSNVNLKQYANNPLKNDLQKKLISYLRDYLLKYLPIYMVPTHIMVLDKFPLTPNGKIDKKSLPEPNINRESIDSDYVIPQTAIEAKLKEIWSDILGIKKIGIYDNFFELGGDSIKSIQISSRASKEGLNIEARQIFILPTIAELGQAIEKDIKSNDNIEDIQVLLTPSKDSFFSVSLPENEKVRLVTQIPLVEDAYQLTPVQTGILFRKLHQDDIYVIQGVFELSGKLDSQIFRAAWQYVMKRHPVLRSGVLWEGFNIPIQYIKTDSILQCSEQDLTENTADHFKEILDEYLYNDKLRGFELEKAPLFRLHLIHIKDTKYNLVWSLHHVFLDGWSLSLIIRDISEVYCQLLNNKLPSLNMVNPYRNYVDWVIKQDVKNAENFWVKYFYGFSEPCCLQNKRHVNFTNKLNLSAYAEHVYELSIVNTQQLIDFAKKNQLSVNTLIQVALGVLLNRYSQKDDVVFGITLSGRSIPLSGIAEMVGLFINTIPLRIKFSNEIVLCDLLRDTQRKMPELLDYSYLSLSKINSCISNNQDNKLLFDTLLVFENDVFNLTDVKLSDELKLSHIKWIENTEYPLTISAKLSEKLRLTFSYKTDCYDYFIIKNASENLSVILNNMSKYTHRKVNDLEFITTRERQLLLIDWNNNFVTNSDCHYLHQLFELQVIKYPDKVAIKYGVEEISYDCLNKKSNQLANLLIQKGLKIESMVAVCCDRSIELVIALLAILKAGYAYVILDPTYPQERIQYILEDTKSEVLLLDEEYEDKFKTYNKKKITLDINSNIIIQQDDANLSITISPNSIAYVMYTSGSMGYPKGVLNTQIGICNRLIWTLKNYPISKSDNFLQTAAVGFDISIWEMLFPLSGGACLIIALPDKHKDIEYLEDIIDREKVSILHFVPSLLELFLEYADISKCKSIKQVVCGGELISNSLCKKFFSKLNAELYHAYGPTEAAISVTHWNCGDKKHLNVVPIGRPISNTKLYILDNRMRLLPIGIPGELYIGGICLAQGYLNNPAMTSNSFILNPFNCLERLYKTGDIARYLPDGNIEFLGREDHQVKLHGHRIELGEIESVLRQHQLVRDVLVIMREDLPGHKYLAAYIVADKKIISTENIILIHHELRDSLNNILPKYMIPKTFNFIENWPLTLNGKIDRNSLPIPSSKAELKNTNVDEYYSLNERKLIAIWCEIFSRSNIGLNDNFFYLGGDSIVCIQLVSRARQQGIYFDIKDIFSAPTISGLAAIAKVKNNTIVLKESSTLVQSDFSFTPIQHHFFNLNLTNVHYYNQAIMLEVNGIIDKNLCEVVLKYLIDHHGVFRFRYSEQTNGWVKNYLNSDDTKINNQAILEYFNLKDMATSNQNDFIATIADEIQAKLNISNGPIFKAVLFESSKKPNQRLLIVIHHLYVDNVSWHILIEDLEKVYDQLCLGNKIQLSAKTSSFIEWSKALYSYSQSACLQNELNYWLAQKPSDSIRLPIDFQHEKNTNTTLESISILLPSDRTVQLLTDSFSSYKADVNTILITALAKSFFNWANSEVLYLTLESHGRELIKDNLDLSQSVGWFTSIFPLCLVLRSHQDIGVAIKQVKEHLRAIPLKGIGYGVLRYLSTSEIKSALNMIIKPTISFNYLGQWNNETSLNKRFLYTNNYCWINCLADNEREYLIDIEAQIINGSLKISWNYSANHFKSITIQKFADCFIKHLHDIIDHCSSGMSFGYTPSDFPLLKLEQGRLDEVFGGYKNLQNIYPLTSTQAGMLFQTLLNPDSDVYFVQSVFELEGDINIQFLREAWESVIDHHAVLRTGFLWVNLDEPRQYILKYVNLVWYEQDWSNEDEINISTKLANYLAIDRQDKFDLTVPPLMRIHFIHLSNQRYYMVWSQHHLLLDGWCLSTIINDVLNSYVLLIKGERPYFEYSRPYSDYIEWLKQQDIELAKKFWRAYLAGYENPGKFNFKLEQFYENNYNEKKLEYGNHSFIISKDKTDKISHFSKQQQLTLNTIVQCAWGLLFSRYTQQNDIIFGVTISGRTIPLDGVEKMIGLFINTLPLRLKFNFDEKILVVLQRLQQEMSTFYQYTYTPLADIKTWCNIPAEQELFNSLIIFENYPIQEYENKKIYGFYIKNVRWVERTEYPITLTVLPGDQLGFDICYKTEYFNYSDIKQLAENFESILNNIILQSNSNINQLQFLSSHELKLQLETWNNTAANYPKNICLHQLIELQAKKTPEKIAVVYEGSSITYNELNGKANQLAHYLQQIGVRQEVLVAVSLARGIDLIVCLLSIMKAGGAYVPIDPNYPSERIHYILIDSNAKFLITQSSLKNNFSSYNGKIININDKANFINYSVVNLENISQPHNLIYVIYTSGSTGKPKGVLITHNNIVNFLNDMKSRLEIQATDCWLSVTTITFDIAALELFLPLITGAKIVVAKHEVISDADNLIQLIKYSACTIMQATPATWQMLINAGWLRSPHMTLLCGGETLHIDLVNSLNFTGGIIWNLYGPTETTIWSTANRIMGTVDQVSIGYPIANTRIYILDANLQMLPRGVPGDIFIAGAGLARGYLHQSELTAERFIEHVFPNNKKERIYKTGDIGRYQSDGSIEYLGRIDSQIKLRGYRIELGEIENRLLEHESIKQAVVISHKTNINDHKIVAHIIPNNVNEDAAMQFSLFYFAASATNDMDNKYSLYLKSAQYGDKVGFKAIWTPERHFHEVGGQYPNPAVLNAALATSTQHIELRAGSVVLPIHNPLRVAEEWSVVDNLSNGRVGIAFASGWNPKDFAFYPDNYQKRKEVMNSYIAQVKTLWEGGKIAIIDGLGNNYEVGVFPKPKQEALPIWLTAAGGPEMFIEAGKIGANVLTHLLGQSIEVLTDKINLYRKTLYQYGFNPQKYTVTLMLHTFVWNTTKASHEISKIPFCEYLKSHISLENMANAVGKSAISNSEDDMQDIIEAAFERYVQSASLIGSVDDCLDIIISLKQHGVDEIACLIDFGIDEEQVLKGLEYLSELNKRCKQVTNINIDKLSHYLKKYLPEYMIPSGYVIHEKLPLTPNGKIDRKQLELKNNLTHKALVPIRAPETDIELKLAMIWQEVLGIEIKNVHDNFFMLGGHSLLATQIISRIRREFSVDLPLRSIFNFPTIAEYVSEITDAICNFPLSTLDDIQKNTEEQFIFPIQSFGDKQPLFLIHSGNGTSFAYLPLAHYFPDQPIYAVSNPRFYDLNNKFISIEEMATYYCKLIKNYTNIKVYRLGGWSFGGLVAYEIARRLQTEGKIVEVVIMIDTHNISSVSYKLSSEEELNLEMIKQGIDISASEAKYFKSELIHNEKLSMQYKPKSLMSRIVLIKAEYKKSVVAPQVILNDNGWTDCVHSKFEIIKTPGTHHELFNSENIKYLAENIYSILN